MMLLSPAIHLISVLLPLIAILSGMAMTPVLLILALLMLYAASRKDWRGAPPSPPQSPAPLLIILLLLLAWPLLSSLWSITPARSASTAGGVIVLCGLAAMALMRQPLLPSPSDRIIRYYALSIAAACLLIGLEALPHGGLIGAAIKGLGMDYERYINKNINRGLCALTLLVWPAVLGLSSLNQRRVAWGLLLLVMLPLLLMQSLSAQLGLLCGILVFALLQLFPGVFPRLVAGATLLFLLCLPALFLTLDAPFLSRPEIARHLPETAQQRLIIWRFTMERVAEKPWRGWGMDTARAIPGGTDIVTIHGANMARLPLHPHNSTLQLLLEEGVIGFLLTLGGIGLVFRQWLRMPPMDKTCHASAGALIVSFLATGLSSFGIWQSWWIATLWAAVLIWRSFLQKPLTRPQSSL